MHNKFNKLISIFSIYKQTYVGVSLSHANFTYFLVSVLCDFISVDASIYMIGNPFQLIARRILFTLETE